MEVKYRVGDIVMKVLKPFKRLNKIYDKWIGGYKSIR